MSNMQIDSVLAQIRSLQQQTKIGAPQLRPAQELGGAGSAAGASQPSFANVMRRGLERVNEAQAKATNIATAFEKGTPGIELSQVMLETQKASVSFRATAEVRNRLVSAYQEIMNMPI
ncbi:MAG: flagellar hook-basal body complex protein FliE [Pseudomonadota bacterium]